MKKSDKIMLIISLVMIIVGFATAICGVAMGGIQDISYNFSNSSFPSSNLSSKEKVEISDNVKNIFIEQTYQEIPFKLNFGGDKEFDCDIVSGEEFSVAYYSNNEDGGIKVEESDVTFEKKGGAVYITILENATNPLTQFSIFGKYQSRLVITVPNDIYLESIKVNAEVLEYKMQNINVETLDFQCNVSDVEVENSNITKATFAVDVGEIEIKDTNVVTCNVSADVGGVEMENVKSTTIDCSVEIGDVEIQVSGEPNEYSVFAYAEIGDVSIDKNISKELSTSKKRITAQVHIGDVEITLK